MKSTLILASLLVSSSAFAGQFDYYNDIDPFGFDKQVPVSQKSRAEVNADTKAALIAGEVARGEQNVVHQVRSTRVRAQAVAETTEALRLGLISHGEQGPIQGTAEQEQKVRLAGLRAIGA